jgi:hypothetical protein
MLRMTRLPDGDTVVLRLEGRLDGPWVGAVRDCWHYGRETNQAKKIRVELAHIYIFDAAGKALLREMHRAGIEIVACGPLTKAIRDEIVAAATKSRTKPGE